MASCDSYSHGGRPIRFCFSRETLFPHGKKAPVTIQVGGTHSPPDGCLDDHLSGGRTPRWEQGDPGSLGSPSDWPVTPLP